jgi:hypothetical protein
MTQPVNLNDLSFEELFAEVYDKVRHDWQKCLFAHICGGGRITLTKYTILKLEPYLARTKRWKSLTKDINLLSYSAS